MPASLSRLAPDRIARHETSPRNADLVLGILSLVGCGIFTGIPAWIMGKNDLKEMDAATMDPEGRQLTNIGKILGMVSCILTVVMICGYVILFGALGGFLMTQQK